MLCFKEWPDRLGLWLKCCYQWVGCFFVATPLVFPKVVLLCEWGAVVTFLSGNNPGLLSFRATSNNLPYFHPISNGIHLGALKQCLLSSIASVKLLL